MTKPVKWVKTPVEHTCTCTTPGEPPLPRHTGINTPDNSKEEFHSDGRQMQTASEMQCEDVISRREEMLAKLMKTPEKQDTDTGKLPSDEPMIKLPQPVPTKKYKGDRIKWDRDTQSNRNDDNQEQRSDITPLLRWPLHSVHSRLGPRKTQTLDPWQPEEQDSSRSLQAQDQTNRSVQAMLGPRKRSQILNPWQPWQPRIQEDLELPPHYPHLSANGGANQRHDHTNLVQDDNKEIERREQQRGETGRGRQTLRRTKKQEYQ